MMQLVREFLNSASMLRLLPSYTSPFFALQMRRAHLLQTVARHTSRLRELSVLGDWSLGGSNAFIATLLPRVTIANKGSLRVIRTDKLEVLGTRSLFAAIAMCPELRCVNTPSHLHSPSAPMLEIVKSCRKISDLGLFAPLQADIAEFALTSGADPLRVLVQLQLLLHSQVFRLPRLKFALCRLLC